VDAQNHFSSTGAVINIPAMVLVALMTVVLVIGIRESARFNNAIVFLKLAVLFLVIGVGFMYVNTANWHPFIPANTGELGHFGWSGVVRGAAVVFFAYIGFDAVSTAAQEAKNPQRDMPIGMLGSLAICTVLYILMALVLTGMVHYSKLNVPHPVFVAIEAAPALKWLTYFINIAAIAGLASVVLVMLMGQPRIFYSRARDGLLPPVFGGISGVQLAGLTWARPTPTISSTIATLRMTIRLLTRADSLMPITRIVLIRATMKTAGRLTVAPVMLRP
jgi:APA family basic amino acid/polyamine antiporter